MELDVIQDVMIRWREKNATFFDYFIPYNTPLLH
jgi:hypothetical protein